jgi:hypothetical protein
LCGLLLAFFVGFFWPFLWASFGLFCDLFAPLLSLRLSRSRFVYGPLCELPSSGIFGRSLFVRCASGTSCGSSSVHGIWVPLIGSGRSDVFGSRLRMALTASSVRHFRGVPLPDRSDEFVGSGRSRVEC